MNEETNVPGPGEGVASAAADPTPAPAVPAKPALIKYTSKIKRGLALMRMVNIASLGEHTPTPQRVIEQMNQRQHDEYNAAMAWIEQEEDWDAVSEVWAKAGGQ